MPSIQRGTRPTRRLAAFAVATLMVAIAACGTDPTSSPTRRANLQSPDSTLHVPSDSITGDSTRPDTTVIDSGAADTTTADTTTADTTIADTTTADTTTADTTTTPVTDSTVSANALTRDVAIDSALTASALIGPDGGSIDFRAAGLKITVPPAALTEPTTISVTVIPGAVVAYEFQPHGLVFLVPITVKQDLTGTSWFRMTNHDQLEAGYFVDRTRIDAVAGVVRVSEFIPTLVDVNSRRAQFEVRHFSGYMLSTGRLSR